MALVKVKLLNTMVVQRPGHVIRAFGHRFEVQPDGSAVAEVHEDFVEGEVAAGRYEVIEEQYFDKEIPDKIIVKNSQKKVEKYPFSNEIETYFGCGNISKFKNRISGLTKQQLQRFSDQKLGIKLPQQMSKTKMIAEITQTTKVRNGLLTETPKPDSKSDMEDN